MILSERKLRNIIREILSDKAKKANFYTDDLVMLDYQKDDLTSRQKALKDMIIHIRKLLKPGQGINRPRDLDPETPILDKYHPKYDDLFFFSRQEFDKLKLSEVILNAAHKYYMSNKETPGAVDKHSVSIFNIAKSFNHNPTFSELFDGAVEGFSKN